LKNTERRRSISLGIASNIFFFDLAYGVATVTGLYRENFDGLVSIDDFWQDYSCSSFRFRICFLRTGNSS
jgi:hypothetical protein